MTRQASPSAGPIPSAFDARFGRGQVEWALWRRVTEHFKRKPSSVFRVRIKHLLEFDRSEPARGEATAFSDDPPAGKGAHGLFSAYDALLLYVGLSLLDIGFKRKEVVLLIRELRPVLRRDLGKIMNARFSAYARGAPLFTDFDPLAPENRIALLLPRVEEPADYVARPSVGGVLVRHGMPAILDTIEDLLLENLIILEIGASAYLLPSLLMQAPLVRRGPRA